MTPSCPSSFVDAKNDGFKQSFVPQSPKGVLFAKYGETWCMAATWFQREIRLRDFINRSGLAAYYQWDVTPTGGFNSILRKK
jgi:hypothetical protein